MAFDVGGKRTGIAVTDPLQIIATPLDTVRSADVWDYIRKYVEMEAVERFIVGDPITYNNRETDSTVLIQKFVKHLEKNWPGIPVTMVDESYSSREAASALVASGMRKKQRQIKENLDKVSATIILQRFMNQ